MDKHLELSFDAGLHGLEARRFSVREGLSTPWQVDVDARSPEPDIPLEAFLDKGASFTIRSGVLHLLVQERKWTGICAHFEQTRVEKPTFGSKPLSSYHLRLRPRLWILGQTEDNRIFQRKTAVEIVELVLGQHGVDFAKKL